MGKKTLKKAAKMKKVAKMEMTTEVQTLVAEELDVYRAIILERKENQELLNQVYSDIGYNLSVHVPETRGLSLDGCLDFLMDHIGEETDNKKFNTILEEFQDSMSFQRVIIYNGFEEGRQELKITEMIMPLGYKQKEAAAMVKNEMKKES